MFFKEKKKEARKSDIKTKAITFFLKIRDHFSDGS